MFPGTAAKGLTKNTSYKVVLPFYIYGGLSFLIAALLLLTSSSVFLQHYFHPQTLAITHIMALGWGTMMILGASHQLVPVLIEGKLYSHFLAGLSFGLAASGIPLLVYSFYVFNMGLPAQWGVILINAAIVIYLINITASMAESKKRNVHAVFIFTGTLWLLLTTLLGGLLVYNFTYPLLTKDSLSYLPVHAHMGIIGWFLLLVTGVGSRLIPLFLISKYHNEKLLWRIYLLINFALISFISLYLYLPVPGLYLIPLAAMGSSIGMFGYFCYQAWKDRLRKKVDHQLKISLLSVGMMALPLVILLIVILLLLGAVDNYHLVLSYGFCIFFGWITAIIFGMTFKTLPFIVWNKIYHHRAQIGKTPSPKDLFNDKVFLWMGITYLAGFFLFTTGILLACQPILQAAAVLLLTAGVLYNGNLWKALTHQPKKNE